MAFITQNKVPCKTILHSHSDKKNLHSFCSLVQPKLQTNFCLIQSHLFQHSSVFCVLTCRIFLTLHILKWHILSNRQHKNLNRTNAYDSNSERRVISHEREYLQKKKNKVDENRTLTTSNCLKNNNKGLCFVATKLNTILNDHEFIKKMINDSTNSLRVATPSQNRNHKMAENHLSTDCNGFCDDSNGRKMFTTIKFIYNFMMIEHVYQLAGALAWTVKQNQ